ncbi:helix-turn-helix domain-containing protein [Parageobacillus toebii]|uniref:helix-turn-helix domain-containing protein n=1 Tax=Parageobacillus toebii TaxID=153151 RepID=UPI001966FC4A|nr:helix-turn-helix transcriptional regulator [Parageobacillus toebii]QSB48802.1 helix-turn-helix transcriptional regulator [Parageobacillus toebii]
MSQVGDRIRELREGRNWSQREFAKRVGINYSVVNRIELGKRSVEDHELAKIADVFGVTTDYLLGRTDNPNPPEESKDKELGTLARINQLIKEYGIEQMGFFDIEKWKSLSEEEIEEIIKHFEWVVHKAREKNKSEDK